MRRGGARGQREEVRRGGASEEKRSEGMRRGGGREGVRRGDGGGKALEHTSVM